jgi:hypothetical protein
MLVDSVNPGVPTDDVGSGAMAGLDFFIHNLISGRQVRRY